MSRQRGAEKSVTKFCVAGSALLACSGERQFGAVEITLFHQGMGLLQVPAETRSKFSEALEVVQAFMGPCIFQVRDSLYHLLDFCSDRREVTFCKRYVDPRLSGSVVVHNGVEFHHPRIGMFTFMMFMLVCKDVPGTYYQRCRKVRCEACRQFTVFHALNLLFGGGNGAHGHPRRGVTHVI